MAQRNYQSGYGNQFSTEAAAGALPLGRNSPQLAPLGLYADLISGRAFTAPRHQNQRNWVCRRKPLVVTGAYVPYEQPHWKSGAAECEHVPLDTMRWNPLLVPDTALNFVAGLRTIVVHGDPGAQTGMAAHLVLMNRSMDGRALVNAYDAHPIAERRIGLLGLSRNPASLEPYGADAGQHRMRSGLLVPKHSRNGFVLGLAPRDESLAAQPPHLQWPVQANFNSALPRSTPSSFQGCRAAYPPVRARHAAG